MPVYWRRKDDDEPPFILQRHNGWFCIWMAVRRFMRNFNLLLSKYCTTIWMEFWER
jgi:hypothetical protein